MAKKYKNDSLEDITISSDSRTYDVSTKVDNMGFVTMSFGESFELRLNYNDVEKISNVLNTAKFIVQDNIIQEMDPSIPPYTPNSSKHWNPSDPVNW